MAELVTTLESVGCRSVRTYIQSGNVVFESSLKSKRHLAKQLGDAIETQFSFRPHVLLLTEEDFRSSVANNPFTDAIPKPKSLHFFFLESQPASPDLDAIAELVNSTERYQLIDSVFYLHAPDGFGKSKLAKGAERKIGVATTARNYSTVHQLLTILEAD